MQTLQSVLHYTAVLTALNYEVISEVVCSVRAARSLSADWKRRIDEDVQKRGR